MNFHTVSGTCTRLYLLCWNYYLIDFRVTKGIRNAFTMYNLAPTSRPHGMAICIYTLCTCLICGYIGATFFYFQALIPINFTAFILRPCSRRRTYTRAVIYFGNAFYITCISMDAVSKCFPHHISHTRACIQKSKN